MAEDNPSWGYARIQGALKHLDPRVARSTIARVLKEHGIKPSPERPMSWATFVRSHAHMIVTADFFTKEVWTARGLVRHFTLFVIDVATRRVHIAGTTTNPTSAWMEQIARNLTDCEEGFLNGKRFLIIDRDAILALLADGDFYSEETGTQVLENNGADERARTADLRITNALLYQLSYIGSRF